MTPSIRPSQFKCRVYSHGFNSPDADCSSHFWYHTLDSGLFVEFSASFSFSGSAFVSAALLVSFSCRLRITYTVTKHRKAPTSKKNWRPRYLWCRNRIDQGSKDAPMCNKHQPSMSPETQQTLNMGLGSLGTFSSGQATAASLGPEKSGRKRRSYPRCASSQCYIKRTYLWKEGGL